MKPNLSEDCLNSFSCCQAKPAILLNRILKPKSKPHHSCGWNLAALECDTCCVHDIQGPLWIVPQLLACKEFWHIFRAAPFVQVRAVSRACSEWFYDQHLIHTFALGHTACSEWREAIESKIDYLQALQILWWRFGCANWRAKLSTASTGCCQLIPLGKPLTL